jgi:hypothetical protein
VRWVLLATITLSVVAAACGDAASCPSLDGIRARMSQAPSFEKTTLPIVYAADGEGRADRAIVVRLIPGQDADALQVQLDGGTARRWERGALKTTLLAEIDDAIAAGRPRIFEVETTAKTHSISLAVMLAELSKRGEVRLMVAKLIQPPYQRLPDWAILTTRVDGTQINVAGVMDISAIADALERAAGGHCAPQLERRMAAAMKDKEHPDEPAVRAALPDALAACGCRGADVDATAWLYEQLMVPTLRTSWIRVNVVEGGTVISANLKYAGDMIHELGKIPLATRVAGVWTERPF